MKAEAQVHYSPEVLAGHKADAALHERGKVQDRRLRRFGKWFAGGVGLQALGVGAAFIPFVGFPLALSLWSLGGVAELVAVVVAIRGRK